MLATRRNNFIVSKQAVKNATIGVVALGIVVAAGTILYDLVEIDISSDVVVERQTTTIEVPYFTLSIDDEK